MENVLHAGMGGIEMSEWIEYTGSDEQIAEMQDAVENGFMLNSTKAAGVFKGGDFMSSSHLFGYLEYCEATHYLICEPHPHADIIKIWADTGCPVWVKHRVISIIPDPMTGYFRSELRVDKTTKPDWNTPGAEYRLTPFED